MTTILIGGWTFYEIQERIQFKQTAVSTIGVVIASEAAVTDSDTAEIRVEFVDAAGEVRRFKSDLYTSGSPYSKGDQVTVWYPPGKPERARVASSLVGDSIIRLVFPGVALFLAVAAWRYRPKMKEGDVQPAPPTA